MERTDDEILPSVRRFLDLLPWGGLNVVCPPAAMPWLNENVFLCHLALLSSSTLLYEKALGVDREFHRSNHCGVPSLHDSLRLLDVIGLYPDHEADCSVAYLY